MKVHETGSAPPTVAPEARGALCSKPELVPLDLPLVRRTVGALDHLYGDRRYFRVEIEGWERLPPPPVMVVANHSGGTTFPDVWGLVHAWYRHFGLARPLRVLGHDLVFASAFWGDPFRRMGVVPARAEVARQVLDGLGQDLLVLPGGDVDTWRPWKDRYRVCFGGRMGYAKLALEMGVPIACVAQAGAHSSLLVLSRGEALARHLHIHALVRASIWPVHLSLPWGLAVGPWPHLPLPVRLRYRIGSPISPSSGTQDEEAAREEQARALDLRVRQTMQALLEELRCAPHRGARIGQALDRLLGWREAAGAPSNR